MRYPIIDGHCDTVHLFCSGAGSYDFTLNNSEGHIDLPRLRKGSVKLQIFALYIEPDYNPVGTARRCIQLIDGYYRTMNRVQGDLQTVFTVSDLHKVMNGSKIAALLSVEGGDALEGDLAMLRILFRLGVRGLGLTWNQRNQLAVGVGEGIKGDGLTPFGQEVVREMNRLGMIVDLAHINEKGFYEAMSLSDKPVIVSHANAHVLCNHPRNLSDNQLRALGENNGIIGLSVYPPFIHRESPSLDKLLDHFVHVAEVAGIDHLGFGSDFDGIDQVINGLEDVSCLYHLVDGLSARGFTPQEIQKITSENYLRILNQVLPA